MPQLTMISQRHNVATHIVRRPGVSPWTGVFALLVAGVATSCGGNDEPVPQGPNVVLISIDTLRADHLGCYGYRRRTSPVIDEIAAAGMLFEQHITSAPWTLPAHAALFTSVPDSVHGVVDPIRTRLSEAFETLPESFQNAGYSTAGFFAGPYLHPAFGLGQGFDRYVDCVDVVADDELDENNTWSMSKPIMRASHHGVTNDKVYGQWKSFHEEVAPTGDSAPFFAFVHLWDVHFDFTPPAPYDTMFDPDYEGRVTGRDFFYDASINAAMDERDKRHIIALYDGEIRWTDEVVGRIRDDLAKAGQLENTILVITSDHGTELFDHGRKGHRSALYEEQIHIPLIIHWPAGVVSGRHDGVTRMIDVGPTLRELCNLPAVATTMGQSLAAIATGEMETRDAPPAVSELISVGQNLRAVRTETDKIVQDSTSQASYWFDLVIDPAENEPREVAEDVRSQELLGLYAEALEEIKEGIEQSPGRAEVPRIPPAIERSLQANGYAGSGREMRESEDKDR